MREVNGGRAMRALRRIGVALSVPGLAQAADVAGPAGPASATGSWFAVVPQALVAAAALVLAISAVGLVRRAFDDPKGEGFSVRGHAGGFGSAGTGWSVSTPLTRLAAGLALAVLAVAMGVAGVPAAPADAAGHRDGASAEAGPHEAKAADKAVGEGTKEPAAAASAAKTDARAASK